MFCPKLLDFGFAARVTGTRRLKGGTPVYMAPEIFFRRPAITRTDVYALGYLLFFVACGRRPLSRYSVPQLKEQIMAGQVPEPAWTPATRLLTKWREVILRSTKIEPSDRPEAAEVHDSIMTFHEEGSEEPSDGWPSSPSMGPDGEGALAIEPMKLTASAAPRISLGELMSL